MPKKVIPTILKGTKCLNILNYAQLSLSTKTRDVKQVVKLRVMKAITLSQCNLSDYACHIQ